MFGSSSLQTPKSGRSRFSKALPAPPSFPTEGNNGPSLMATSNPPYQSYQPSQPYQPYASHTALGNNNTPTHTPTYTYTQPQAQTQAQAQAQMSTSSPVRQFPASLTGLPFLKELPPIDLGPPLPPLKAFEEGIFNKEGAMAAVKPLSAPLSSPLNSPLPPLPHKPGPGPQPPMSIPRRRPVGAPAQAQPQTPTVTLAPAPAPAPAPVPLPVLSPVPVLASAPSLAPSAAPDTAPEIISPNPLPSPVTSLSSLLSAYTDHTSESTPRTSTNSANDSPGTKDPQRNTSPNPETSRGIDSPTLPPGPAAHANVNNEKPLPPPLPVKDSRVNLQKPQPQPQPNVGLENVSPIDNTSPTEQLWRRRSVKSEKNIAVPELKLTSSNGSTVDPGHITASISSQDAPNAFGGVNSVPVPSQIHNQTASSIPSKPRVILPKSSNAGLPGKNIRPVASRQQIKTEENMGKSASRLNDNGLPTWGNNINSKDSGKPEVGTTNQHTLKTGAPFKALPSPNSPHNIARLPTPDYENNEARNALAATVVSPVSPASSPELPIDGTTVISPTSPRDATEKISEVSENKPAFSNLNIPRQPVGLPSSPAANRFQNRNRSPAQNFPARTSSKAKDPSRDIGDQQPAMEVPASLRVGIRKAVPPPASNWAEITPQAGPTEPEKPFQDKHNSPELEVSLDASTPSQQMAEGELDENMTDNPGAALFPRDWFSPLPDDGVMDALPLTDRHFRCITSHRYMTANRQRYNPIACAICGHRDRLADAHICSACHLNVCANCSTNLRRFRGNLQQLLDQIGETEATAEEDDRTVTMTRGEEDDQVGRVAA